MAVLLKSELLRRYGAALAAGSAALFIGAGVSQPSGFVNWRSLLKEIAEDLGLDIEKETDFVSLAQFHVNERGGRAKINEILIDEFTKTAVPNPNHREIAALPISTIWTTNYDDLIERAFVEARKKPDVKTTTANLAQTIRDRDVVIYKMHGDRHQPQDAVLTREDYEIYNETRGAFSIALQGDLIEKTFLFLGFSFTDPNIDHILARIRALVGKSQRDHFCIMKKPDFDPSNSAAARAEHEYVARKLELRISDLGRYRIQTILVDSYAEIPEILRALNQRSHLKDVFVSGSYVDASPWGGTRLEKFCRLLGYSLIKQSLNVTSGFGLGIGSSVSYGALNEIYSKQIDQHRIRLMPFPQVAPETEGRAELFSKHRETIVSQTGFTIFISGNRQSKAGPVENSPGVLEEFAITTKMEKFPIPLGASGWSAMKIWEEVNADQERYYGKIDVADPLRILGESGLSDEEYLSAILEIISRCSI
jgi:hypothetical protein